MKLLPFISLFFVAILAIPSASATGNNVTPAKEQVTQVMLDYNLSNQNNSYQLACEIGQYVSEEYSWNCDIRQLNFSKHASVYINVFYPAADNKKGYTAYYGWFGPQKKEVTGFWDSDRKMYYRDWYEPGKECYISGVCSYGIVKSYFGNVTEGNVTENESTQPVVIIVPDNSNGSAPAKPMYEAQAEVYNNTFEDSGNNNTVQSIELKNNEINNAVENSTNTVSNQGVIDSIKQYFVDFKNANLSNVTFNFWGN